MTAALGYEFSIRFWSNVDCGEVSECWPWKRYRDEKGYGRVAVGRTPHRTHRVAYMLHHGTSDLGDLHVLHTCDNPKCCNPSHLYLGTNADNMADKVARNRQARLRGESAGTAKLTDALVTSMRKERIAGVSIAALAVKYEVDKSTASDILHGRTWFHLFGTDGHPSYRDLVLAPKTPLGGATLSFDDAATIMRRLADGEPGKRIARDHGIHFQTVSDIKNGRSWAHLAGTNGLPTVDQMQNAKPKSKTVAKLNASVAADIKRRLRAGETARGIASRYGLSPGAVYHIKNGRTWTHV